MYRAFKEYHSSFGTASFHSLHGSRSSCRRTMSLTFMFLLFLCHFCLGCKFKRYSFLQWVQNSLDEYWTLCHLFWRSSLTSCPGGGRMIVDFILRMWFGVKGSGSDGSFKCSAVNGLLLMTAISSYRNVLREVLSSLCADWSRMAVRTHLTIRIYRSQTPPIHKKNTSKSLSWSISFMSNSLLAPTKLVPWAHFTRWTLPLMVTNVLKALINTSVVMSSIISVCMSLEHRQTSKRPYICWSICFFNRTKGAMNPKGSYTEATVESTPLLVSGLGFTSTLNLNESDVMHPSTSRALSICSKLKAFHFWDGCHHVLTIGNKLVQS